MKHFLYKKLCFIVIKKLPLFLVGIFLSTALSMTVYEILKEMYFDGQLTHWESHIATIIVTSLFATMAAFFMFKLTLNLVKDSQEARLSVSAVIKHLFDAVIIIDEKGVIKTVNPAANKMFGYTNKEIIDQNVSILMPEPFATEHDSYLHNYLTTKIPKILGKTRREVLGKRANGEIFPLDLVTTEMVVNGQIEFIGIIRDMTEYKRAENEVTRLREIEKQRFDYLQHELEMAGLVQESMLPTNFAPFSQHCEFDIFASMTPARLIGGDFYDVFFIAEGQLFVAVGDVTGKGISAALHMTQCIAHLRRITRRESKPHKILHKLNNLLCENNALGVYTTFFCGVLNIKTGELVYSSAGHPSPITNTNSGDFEFIPMPIAIVLGFMSDIKYVSSSLQLKPGDTIFIYTDGVTDAENKQQELFSDEKLLQLLAVLNDKNVFEIIKGVKKEIDTFSDGVEQTDDITMLALRYFGEQS